MAGSITAHEIFQRALRSAEDELRRSSTGLAFSGLSAGLNIGFSFVAVAAAHAHGGGAAMAAVVYPVGFIFVILAHAQLFTENTLPPVLLVLDEFGLDRVRQLLRLWAVVLAANIAGAFIFAWALSAFDISPALPREALLHAAEEAYRGGWGALFLRGIFGGWLVALLVWMLHGDSGVLGQIVLVWVVVFLIQAAGFAHSVAGAVEVLYLALQGSISFFDWAWNFQTPVTLGNAVGGVVFVALVNYAQVVGAGADVVKAEAARRRQEREDAAPEPPAGDDIPDRPPGVEL